jgi:hypothetical protein
MDPVLLRAQQWKEEMRQVMLLERHYQKVTNQHSDKKKRKEPKRVFRHCTVENLHHGSLLSSSSAAVAIGDPLREQQQHQRPTTKVDMLSQSVFLPQSDWKVQHERLGEAITQNLSNICSYGSSIVTSSTMERHDQKSLTNIVTRKRKEPNVSFDTTPHCLSLKKTQKKAFVGRRNFLNLGKIQSFPHWHYFSHYDPNVWFLP